MNSGHSMPPSVVPKITHETVPARFRFRTTQDILELLEAQIVAVERDPELGTLDKAKAIGSLSRAALQAKEVLDQSNRVEAIEATLSMRREFM